MTTTIAAAVVVIGLLWDSKFLGDEARDSYV
jgi:hypothetical protein